LQSQSPQTARVAATPRAPSTIEAQSTTTAAAPQADPFEPPPPGLSAAQMQARAAGAVSPTPVPAAQASAYDANAGAARQQAATSRTAPQMATSRAPDPIDAAADAFEPPPPASVAARQAQQADENGSVQIMRASTGARSMPAPTQTNDDPIARFANGNF
ncbi:peptidoglycan endopeptidase, partial [Paraburkholderia dipogonis]